MARMSVLSASKQIEQIQQRLHEAHSQLLTRIILSNLFAFSGMLAAVISMLVLKMYLYISLSWTIFLVLIALYSWQVFYTVAFTLPIYSKIARKRRKASK